MTGTSVTLPASLAQPAESARLRAYQRRMVMLMVVGYAGFYLCRSDLSVATPLIIKEFRGQGIDKEAIGSIASIGLLGYAAGKFVNGSLADRLGGRKLFLTGMGGAVLFSILFGLSGGIPLFTLAWLCNRTVQSTGWVGMVKLTGRWFSYATYGAAMGVISLSYLFGDFASRYFLGQLVEWNVGWRGLFFVAAAVLAVIFIANALLLRESPRDIGEPEPAANPLNVFGEAGQDDRPATPAEILGPLLRSPAFWAVCALSFGFTLLRETFNNWIPQYLTEVAHMQEGAAGKASSLFPLVGGISVLLAGYASDRLGRIGRAAIILVGLLFTIAALLALAYVPLGASRLLPVVYLGAVAFVMLGPYSFLAGAVSLDFGGKRGSATACGWIDGIGYIGGMISGYGIGKIAEKAGWQPAFLTLAGVAAASCLAAAIYLRMQLAAQPGQVSG